MNLSRTRATPAGPPARTIRAAPGGIGRRSSPAAERVSDALRRATGGFVEQRRRTAALSLASIAGLGVVAAYQHGLLRHLPEPPLPFLDADRVDASGEAYAYLRTPDASLGIASSAITLVLAGMGDDRRTSQQPWVPLALAAKVVLDAGFGAFLTLEQLTKHRRLCSWCLVAAGASVASLPQVLPEARAALQSCRRSG